MSSNSINMVDFAVFGLLMLSGFIGILRGFTREVLGVAAWIGALFAALYGIVWTRPLLAPYIKSAFIADVVAGIVIFVIALFFLGTLSRNVSRTVKGSVLGGLDRSLGLVFGVVRGGVIVIIAYFGATLVYPKMEKWPAEVKDAKSYPYVVEGTDWMKTLFPSDITKRLGLVEKQEEEGLAKDKSVDAVVSELSQPKPAAPVKPEGEEKKGEPKKEEGYPEANRDDMEKLVKKNG